MIDIMPCSTSHNEPEYAYGPFVMNSEEEIRKCISDYQSGKMGIPEQVDAIKRDSKTQVIRFSAYIWYS